MVKIDKNRLAIAHPTRKKRVRAVAPLRPSPGPVSSLFTDGVRPQDALFLSSSLFLIPFTLISLSN